MIFIPGSVPSSKNSKVKAARGIFSSPAVNAFLRTLGIQSYNSKKKYVKGYVDKNRPNVLEGLREEIERMKVGKNDPLFIGFHHVRAQNRQFDFSNSLEIIQDLFTAHDFIEDDSVKYMLPLPMTIEGEIPTLDNLRNKEWYSVDKKNPGVWIKIF
jgi:hypothetical protein